MKLSRIPSYRALSPKLAMIDGIEHPPPAQWERLVERHPAFEADIHDSGLPEILHSDDNLAKIHTVFRSLFLYERDREHDVWEPGARTYEWSNLLPDHTAIVAIGDCEDYALLVWGYLISGAPWKARLARCKIMPSGVGHAVLICSLPTQPPRVIDVRRPDVPTLDSTLERRFGGVGWGYRYLDCFDPETGEWKWLART